MSDEPPSAPHVIFQGFGDDAGGIPRMSNRDTACLVLPDLNYDEQLRAVKQLLSAHRKLESEERAEIAEIKQFVETAKGMRAEYAQDELIERFHWSVYDDAARSMAAVGMLAPLIESVFDHGFAGIQEVAERLKISHPSHPRWVTGGMKAWDCHLVLTPANGWKPGLVDGIGQLSEAVGLRQYLPPDLSLTLQALFEYRNKMFHLGVEWKPEERRAFEAKIVTMSWPSDWFSKATSGGEPWVFYMTPQFISHCVQCAEQVIEGIGAYCNATFMPKPAP